MPEIILIGLSHKTAAIELRECLDFTPDRSAATLKRLHAEDVIEEVLLFSTCNRVEILIATENTDEAVATVKACLLEDESIPIGEKDKFEDALYVYAGDAAVRHVFKVTASLDSMVVGEPQILGQVKEAYRLAIRQKTSGVILNRLLHRSFFTAKRVRTETGIGNHAVSISYAAIELARKIFGTFEDKRVLLIGAGEMAELAVEHMLRHRVGEIRVVNRTFENAVLLAKKFNGTARSFDEMESCLQFADIIISSTGAGGFILTPKQVKAAMRTRRNRPIFFIDIAVPRDIDPEINRIDNTYVYDIDDLNGVVNENIKDRHQEAKKAERIIDEALMAYKDWFAGLAAVPTIVALRRKFEGVAEAEVNKTLRSLKHLDKADRSAIRRMVRPLVNKLLHDPTVLLKNNQGHRKKPTYFDAIRTLFKLDD